MRDVPRVSSPGFVGPPHHPLTPPPAFRTGAQTGNPLRPPQTQFFHFPGGTLVWHDNTAVNYSNWGQHDTGPSMLSQNSCYWIQSSNGVWRLGSCTNVTMGVICKIPRGRDPPAEPGLVWGEPGVWARCCRAGLCPAGRVGHILGNSGAAWWWWGVCRSQWDGGKRGECCCHVLTSLCCHCSGGEQLFQGR